MKAALLAVAASLLALGGCAIVPAEPVVHIEGHAYRGHSHGHGHHHRHRHHRGHWR